MKYKAFEASFRVILILILSSLSAFFVWQNTVLYLEYNTVITSHKLEPDLLRYPDLTICTKFRETGSIIEALEKYSSENVTKAEVNKILNEIAYSKDELLMHFSHTFDTGGYNDIARNNLSLWSSSVPHPEQSGLCHTYQPYGENKPGKWFGYKIWIKIPEDAFDATNLTEREIENKKSVFMFNIEMFLHKRDSFVYYKEDDLPNIVKIDTSILRYQAETSIVFSTGLHEFMNQADNPCESSDQYSFKTCIDKKFLGPRDWQDPWYSNPNIDLPESDNKTQISEFYEKVFPKPELKLKDRIYMGKAELEKKGCYVPCKTNVYKLFYTYIPRESIDTGWKHEQFDFAISIWAKNFETWTSQELLACDFSCLQGQIGGAIGLFLGVSFLALFDISIIFCRTYLYHADKQ